MICLLRSLEWVRAVFLVGRNPHSRRYALFWAFDADWALGCRARRQVRKGASSYDVRKII